MSPHRGRAGARIDGRFELRGELGRGGMGVVHKAWDENAQRMVALKLLGKGALNAQRLERFRREGQATASIQHPGILRVHAMGQDENRPYIAYELVEGVRTFGEAAKSAERTQVVAWIRDASLALGAAHAAGIVHRDVKPENLLIDARGHLRVADFGLALATDVERLTVTGAILGTPHYMAPEQLAGKGSLEVGPAADVWALGVILYESLRGELPFQGGTFYELAAQVLNGTPLGLPSRRTSGAEADLHAISLKALARDASARYPDARALAADLTRAIEGDSIEAEFPTWRAPRAQTLALVACGLIVTASLALALIWKPEDPHARDSQQAGAASSPRQASPTPVATPSPTHAPAALSPPPSEDELTRVADYFLEKGIVTYEHKEPGTLEYNVGEMLRGDGAFERALIHYERAAGKGHGKAMERIGMFHATGRGRPKNLQKAAQWYQRSAEAGYAGGVENLVGLLLKGSVDRPWTELWPRWVRLLETAAKGGSVTACLQLRKVLHDGKPGVARDPVAAKRWAKLGESLRRAELQREGKLKD